jgi:outer membrane protein OmpA-like peptidoglycan-associated protein
MHLLLAAVLALAGCASAYDETYEKETQRLEAEEHSRRQAERKQLDAEHADASRYAAVVYFEVGSAVIKEDGYRELTWFSEKIAECPQCTLLVQGFADTTGGDTTNQRLSTERAAAVAQFLQTQGIAASRMATSGFASEFPAASNETNQGRRNNRRVEVTVR